MAGIEASTITSLGTWRLVMPLSELTIARRGPSASALSKAALISAPFSSPSRPARTAAKPLVPSSPAASSCSPYAV